MTPEGTLNLPNQSPSPKQQRSGRVRWGGAQTLKCPKHKWTKRQRKSNPQNNLPETISILHQVYFGQHGCHQFFPRLLWKSLQEWCYQECEPQINLPKERPCTRNYMYFPKQILCDFKTAVGPQRSCQSHFQRFLSLKAGFFLASSDDKPEILEYSVTLPQTWKLGWLPPIFECHFSPKVSQSNDIRAHTPHYLKCPKTLQHWWFYSLGHSSNV